MKTRLPDPASVSKYNREALMMFGAISRIAVQMHQRNAGPQIITRKGSSQHGHSNGDYCRNFAISSCMLLLRCNEEMYLGSCNMLLYIVGRFES